MAIDVTRPQSRRSVIAGAIGGTAALAAASLGRPLAAQAADGDAVQVGHTYAASTVTAFDAGGTSATALEGDSGSGIGVLGSSESGVGLKGVCPSGIGVWAESTASAAVHAISDGDTVQAISDWGEAVSGTSTDGTGVAGHGSNGPGVSGDSNGSHGVGGFSWASGAPGIIGRSLGANTGVFGYCGSAPWTPTTPSQTGVYGYADQGSAPHGVHGQTTLGYGVYGQASSGTGVRGITTTGIGGFFAATTLATGTGLRAQGRVWFDHAARLATVPAGKSSVIVTPGFDLTATSAVVATLNGDAGGSTTVKRVAVNTTSNTFTIYLTANATVNVKVAWHVFG